MKLCAVFVKQNVYWQHIISFYKTIILYGKYILLHVNVTRNLPIERESYLQR